MKSILIVEDDAIVKQVLLDICRSLNVMCHVAKTLDEGYTLLEQFRPEVIILDRLLPDGDGLELATYVQDAFFTTRILCISTLGLVAHRITGFESGIDDYVPKPFSAKELELRLCKLLHSEKVHSDATITLGGVRFFPESGMLVYENVATRLRKKESLILNCLSKHRNQVVAKEKIINYVWQGDSEQPAMSTLDVYIRRIRSKLGFHAHMIQTARGFGYSIVIP